MADVFVLLDVAREQDGSGVVAVGGTIEFCPVVRRVEDSAVVVPDSFSVALVAGDPAPTVTLTKDDGTTWAWQVLERTPAGVGSWQTFTVSDVPDDGTIAYADLTALDPDTLLPLPEVPTVGEAIAAEEAAREAGDAALSARLDPIEGAGGTDTQVWTADGAGGASWQDAPEGGGSDLDGPVAALVDDDASATQASLNARYGSFGATLPALLAYQDFTGLSDGAIDGTVAPTGQTWDGTGSTPPAVVDGGLQSTGTGYAFLDAGAKVSRVDIEFEYAGSGSSQSLIVSLSQAMSTIDDLCHFVINPSGGNLSFLVGGAWSTSHQPDSGYKWVAPLVNGETYRVSVLVDGDTAMIVGPHGELFQLSDPRVAATAGNIMFLEPTGSASGRYPRVLNMAAHGVASRVPAQHMNGAGLTTDAQGRIVGNRFTQWETAIGRESQAAMPSIRLGAEYVTARLTADVSSGATTITTDTPIPPAAYLATPGDNQIIIDPQGVNQETVTVSGSPGGTGPYTRTVTALANDHTTGTLVYLRTTRNAVIYLNTANGFLRLPGNSYVDGGLYIGGNLDVALVRDSAYVMRMGNAQMFDVGKDWNNRHLRMGSHHLWVDSSGNLRIKNGSPSSDADGTVVGTQT